MTLEIPLLDADSTCATCPTNRIREYDTSHTDLNETVTIAGYDLYDSLDNLEPDIETFSGGSEYRDFNALVSGFALASALYLLSACQRTRPRNTLALRDFTDWLFRSSSGSLVAFRRGMRGESTTPSSLPLSSSPAQHLLQQRFLLMDAARNWRTHVHDPEDRIGFSSALFSALESQLTSSVSDFMFKLFAPSVAKAWTSRPLAIVYSPQAEAFLSDRPPMKRVVSDVVIVVDKELRSNPDVAALIVELTKDPDSTSSDLRLNVKAGALDFDAMMELWARLSPIVETRIRKTAQTLGLSNDEVEDILDTFTVSVVP